MHNAEIWPMLKIDSRCQCFIDFSRLSFTPDVQLGVLFNRLSSQVSCEKVKGSVDPKCYINVRCNFIQSRLLTSVAAVREGLSVLPFCCGILGTQ